MSRPGLTIQALLLATIVVSGCSPRYSTIISRYEQASVCCQSIKDFRFESIQHGDSIEFKLDEESPAFVFNTGKSFFKAFTMPAYNYPYRINIHSYIQGQYIELAHIFIPQIIFLNDRHEITRVVNASIFSAKKNPISETSGLRFKVEGHIDISHDNKDERYFIVMTSQEHLKGKTQFSMMQSIPLMIVPGSIIPLPTGEKAVLIPNSPFGKLKIDLN